MEINIARQFRPLTTFVAAVLLCFCLGPATYAQNEDVISVESSIVIVNASVTGPDGKAVRGLKLQHFRIFEDGAEQQINSFGAEETPFAAVVLLDTSGSMEERVTLARSAAIQFLAGIRNTDNVSIYNFDSKVSLVQEFSNTRDLREQIFDLKATGMTVLNDAVYRAAEELSKREEKRRAIVILSDGADTLSKVSQDKALKAAMAAGATIYSVDMAPQNTPPAERARSQGALKSFSERSGGQFIATPGGLALRDAFKRIVEELGVQYTISYEPKSKKDGKWHSIDVQVSKPNVIVRARKGYNAPKK